MYFSLLSHIYMIWYIYILFFFVPNKKKYEIEFICSRFFLSCCCLILYEDDIIFSLGEVGEFRLNRDNSAHTHTDIQTNAPLGNWMSKSIK